MSLILTYLYVLSHSHFSSTQNHFLSSLFFIIYLIYSLYLHTLLKHHLSPTQLLFQHSPFLLTLLKPSLNSVQTIQLQLLFFPFILYLPINSNSILFFHLNSLYINFNYFTIIYLLFTLILQLVS